MNSCRQTCQLELELYILPTLQGDNVEKNYHKTCFNSSVFRLHQNLEIMFSPDIIR